MNVLEMNNIQFSFKMLMSRKTVHGDRNKNFSVVTPNKCSSQRAKEVY